MSAKVFIPQDQVDAWVTADKVDLTGETMTFRVSGLSLRVVPAYYFDHVSAGSDTHHGLLGRAKSKAAVNAMGAEAYMDSVILADTAYDVEAGLIGKSVDANCTRQAMVAAIVEAGS